MQVPDPLLRVDREFMRGGKLRALAGSEGAEPGVRDIALLLARFACNNHTICNDELEPIGALHRPLQKRGLAQPPATLPFLGRALPAAPPPAASLKLRQSACHCALGLNCLQTLCIHGSGVLLFILVFNSIVICYYVQLITSTYSGMETGWCAQASASTRWARC